jgi:type III restriction enzyme
MLRWLSIAQNAGLGFAIPYLFNGQMHDYVPDFLIRLKSSTQEHIILETKGYDQLEQLKRAAAKRWVAAVNAEASYGRWNYLLAKNIESIPQLIMNVAKANPRF